MLATIIALALVETARRLFQDSCCCSMSIRTGQDNSARVGRAYGFHEHPCWPRHRVVAVRTQLPLQITRGSIQSQIFGPPEAMEMVLKLRENDMISRIAGQ